MKFFSFKELSREDKVLFTINLILQILLLGAAIFAFAQGQWFNGFLTVIILLITLLPALIAHHYDVFIPLEFSVLASMFIIGSLYLGEVHSYYTLYWWWDVVLHTTSGVLAGFIGFALVYVLQQGKKVRLNPGLIALFAFCFALALGALWEIFEFFMDVVFGFMMQHDSLHDTMWDLIVDMVGAFLISASGYIYITKRRVLPLSHAIHKFTQKNPWLFRKRRK